MFKTYSKEELSKILKDHEMWLNDYNIGKRADLRRADLQDADLQGVTLRRANLQGANLQGANLWRADLQGADLHGANLWRANLQGADLWRADLRRADLRRADFQGANLHGATFRGADLHGANLRWAELWETSIDFPIACPEKGSFIGFKRAGKYIVELEITADAFRCSATSRKCRCSKAKVLSITTFDGESTDISCVASDYDSSFLYEVGKIVEVEDFDTNRWNECAPGIHFFITRQEAVDY